MGRDWRWIQLHLQQQNQLFYIFMTQDFKSVSYTAILCIEEAIAAENVISMRDCLCTLWQIGQIQPTQHGHRSCVLLRQTRQVHHLLLLLKNQTVYCKEEVDSSLDL